MRRNRYSYNRAVQRFGAFGTKNRHSNDNALCNFTNHFHFISIRLNFCFLFLRKLLQAFKCVHYAHCTGVCEGVYARVCMRVRVTCVETKSSKTFSTYLMELQSFVIAIVFYFSKVSFPPILFPFLIWCQPNRNQNRTEQAFLLFHARIHNITHMSEKSAQKQKTICTKSCTKLNFLHDDGPFFCSFNS